MSSNKFSPDYLSEENLARSGKRFVFIVLLVFAAFCWGGYALLCSGSAHEDARVEYDPASIEDEIMAEINSLKELLELDKTDYKTHFKLGQKYLEMGDIENAIKHFQLARKYAKQRGSNQEKYDILTGLAKARIANKEFYKALVLLDEAKKIKPNLTGAYNTAGNAYDAQKLEEEARREYNKAIGIDKRHPTAYQNLANQATKNNKPNVALEFLRQAIRNNPKGSKGFENLGDHYRGRRKFAEAKKAFQRAISLNKGSKWDKSRLYYKLSRVNHGLGDEKARLAALKKGLAINPKDSQLLKEMGDIALAAKDKKKALDYYKRSLARDFKNQELRNLYNTTYQSYLSDLKKQESIKDNDSNLNAIASNHTGSGSAIGSNSSLGNAESNALLDGGSGIDGPGSDGTNGISSNSSNTTKGPNSQNKSINLKNNTVKNNTNQANDQGSKSLAQKEIESGLSAFKAKQYAIAEKHFVKAQEVDPSNAKTPYYLGRSQHRQGKLSSAVESYKKAMAKDPTNDKASYYLGGIYFKKKQYGHALRAFKASVSVNPKFTNARYALALTYEKLNENKRASEHYKKTIQLNPRLYSAHYNLGMTQKKSGQYKAAIASFEKAGSIKSSAEANAQIGELYSKIGQRSKAISYYKTALRQDINHPQARFNLAIIYVQQKKRGLAKAELTTLIKKNSRHAEALYQLGKIEQEGKNIDSAIHYYKRSVKINPSYFKGHLNLGKAYYQKGSISKAETSYKNAIASSSRNPDGYGNLGNLYLKQKEYSSARSNYEKALRLRPKSMLYRLALAESLEKQGLYKEAKRQYEQVLRGKSNRRALEKLAFIYYRKLKDDKSALRMFEKLLHRYPNHKKRIEFKRLVAIIKAK